MKRFILKVKKSCHKFMTGQSGFSLVELIVVIAIMAVMAAVLAPSLLGYVEKSRMQKDASAMDEVSNAMTLSLADQDIYDELLVVVDSANYSCYADGDTSTNIDANKTITKSPDLWLYNDSARLLDETVYKPAGKMRGVTITFKPNGSAEYILKDGIVNQMGAESTKKGLTSLAGKTLAETDFETLYNRLRSTVGDTIKVSSQTYRNSDYTIFISMGTTGGNQADKQDAIQVYGQYNGTNLPNVTDANDITADNSGAPSTPDLGGNSSNPELNGGSNNPPSAPVYTIPEDGCVEYLVTIYTCQCGYTLEETNGNICEVCWTAPPWDTIECLYGGSEFPAIDKILSYTDTNYTYTYDSSIDGWSVSRRGNSMPSAPIADSIAGKDVKMLEPYFYSYLSGDIDASTIYIPSTVISMGSAFEYCNRVYGTLEIPEACRGQDLFGMYTQNDTTIVYK